MTLADRPYRMRRFKFVDNQTIGKPCGVRILALQAIPIHQANMSLNEIVRKPDMRDASRLTEKLFYPTIQWGSVGMLEIGGDEHIHFSNLNFAVSLDLYYLKPL